MKRYNPAENEKENAPTIIDADGNIEYEVQSILDNKRSRRKIYYLVQFQNNTPKEAVWMRKNDLKNCRQLIKEFENQQRR